MSEEDILIFVKSLERRIEHIDKMLNKITYDIHAVIKDGMREIYCEERLEVRAKLRDVVLSSSELRKQNHLLRQELRLTKQSKKIMEFLKPEKEDSDG